MYKIQSCSTGITFQDFELQLSSSQMNPLMFYVILNKNKTIKFKQKFGMNFINNFNLIKNSFKVTSFDTV